MAILLYGSGPRLMECLRLRVKDPDFGEPLFEIDVITIEMNDLTDPHPG